MTPHLKAAIKKIQDCIDTQAPVLDLSDLALPEIPALLKECTHLQTLYLGPDIGSEAFKDDYHSIDWQLAYPEDYAKKALIKYPSMGNYFKKIEHLPAGLLHLYIWNNGFEEIGGLSPMLETLQIVSNKIRAVPQLPATLKKLTLASGKIKKIKGLPTGLQMVNLSFNKIQKIESLPNGLQTVNLSSNQIQKIEGLPKGLQTINLSSNQIQKIEGLPDGLQTVNLNSNQIQKIEGLPAGLQSLELNDNQILKISGLTDGLQTVDLGSNQIQKISGLPDGLQTVNLGSNQIQKIEGLPDGLQSVNLSYNQIQKIEGLPDGLQTAFLSFNQIQKIEGLPDSLQTVNLISNQIQKIEGLPDGLQSVNLSYNQIQKIEGLTDGLKTADLSFNQIQEIAGLTDGLQSVNLSSNQIHKIESLPDGLQTADLSFNQIQKIEGLPDSLQAVNLSFNQIQKIVGLPDRLQTVHLNKNQIQEIAGLPDGLQTIHLNRNQIQKIEGLPDSLHVVNLSGNEIQKIEGLPDSLQVINLIDNQIQKIESLTDGLQVINLSSNQIQKTGRLPAGLQTVNLNRNQIQEIESLPSSLQSADLSSNQIQKIEGLPSGLQSVDLSYNQIQKIEALPNGLQAVYLGSNQIEKMEALPARVQTVDLSYNQIQKIEALPDGLQRVYLHENQIQKIEGLPDGLKTVDLSSNQIQKIERLPDSLQILMLWNNQIQKIENLPANLQSVDLSSNQIGTIDLETVPKNLHILSLYGNPIKNAPSEILIGNNSPERNCLPDLKAWFADLEKGYELNKQIKLMISGNGNVGKSSVLEALKTGKCEIEFESTHAITLDELAVQDIAFRVWDFGGQEIFHGTHRMFLSSKAVNLVVFDKKTEALSSVPDRINPEETTRNHKVTYWLKTINELNEESPLIIVQNKIDQDARDRETAALAAAQGCSFYHISATTGDGVNTLKSMLQEEAQHLSDYNMKMPLSWLKVRARIAETLALEADKRMPLIDKATFASWCEDAGVLKSSEPALLRYLHHTGNLYHHEYLKDRIILDQLWALEGIYKLLDRSKPFYKELRDDWQGRVRARRLFGVWGDQYSYSDDDKKLFLTFLESCGQCFRLGDDRIPLEEAWYLFPEFLASEIGVDARDLWEEHCKNGDIRLCYFRYRHQFLHFYRIQQIIVALGRKTSTSNIWRNGIQINTTEGWLRIQANYHEEAIEVIMEEKVKNRWLKEIIELVQGNSGSGGWENHLKDWEERLPNGEYESVKDIERYKLKKPLVAEIVEKEAPEAIAKTLPEQLPDNKKKEIMVAYPKEYIEVLERLRRHFGGYYDRFEDLWFDKKLKYKGTWQKDILAKIRTCDGIILLAGPEYFHPDKKFIREQELPCILQRHKEEQVPVACIQVKEFYSPLIHDNFVFFDKAAVFDLLPDEQAKDKFMIEFLKDFIQKHFQ